MKRESKGKETTQETFERKLDIDSRPISLNSPPTVVQPFVYTATTNGDTWKKNGATKVEFGESERATRTNKNQFRYVTISNTNVIYKESIVEDQLGIDWLTWDAFVGPPIFPGNCWSPCRVQRRIKREKNWINNRVVFAINLDAECIE